MNCFTPLLNLTEILGKNFSQTIFTVALFGSIKRKAVPAKDHLVSAEADEKQNQAVIELMRQCEFKDRLMSIIAHDFRSPLFSLKSLLGLLSNQKIGQKEFQRVVALLHSQVEHLDQFTENILKWAHNNSTEIKPKFEQLSLRPMVNETVGLLSAMAEGKGITIYFEVPEDLTVFADQEMIKLVLRNLIMNAIKFCRSNDRINIAAKNQNEMVSISVCDTGQGIAQENMPTIFKRSHLTTKGTKNEVGVGLGLTLCKGFVEKMGGTILATSSADKGSCFEFTVHSPIAPPSEFQRFIEKHERGSAG